MNIRLCLLTILLWVSHATATQVVVVTEFDDRTNSSLQLGKQAQDEITNILHQLPQVQVVERDRM